MNVRCMASLELGRVFAPDFLVNVERENGYEYPVPFLNPRVSDACTCTCQCLQPYYCQ